MIEDIDVELDEETDTYYISIDGGEYKEVSEDCLRDLGSDLHLHFVVHEVAPPYNPEDTADTEASESPEVGMVSDEEIEEELEDLEASVEDIDLDSEEG